SSSGGAAVRFIADDHAGQDRDCRANVNEEATPQAVACVAAVRASAALGRVLHDGTVAEGSCCRPAGREERTHQGAPPTIAAVAPCGSGAASATLRHVLHEIGFADRCRCWSAREVEPVDYQGASLAGAAVASSSTRTAVAALRQVLHETTVADSRCYW